MVANQASKNRLRKGNFVSPIPSNLARPFDSHQANPKPAAASSDEDLPSDKNTDTENNLTNGNEECDLPPERIKKVFLDPSLLDSVLRSPEQPLSNRISVEPSTSNFTQTETLGIATMTVSIPPPAFDPLKSLMKNNKVIPMEEIRTCEAV